MSSSILRASVRRNAAIANKRFYSAPPPPAASAANNQQGGGNGGLFLGLAAAGGIGYYLYQRSVGKLNWNVHVCKVLNGLYL